MSAQKILHVIWIFISVASSAIIATTMSSPDKLSRESSNKTSMTPEASSYLKSILHTIPPEVYESSFRKRVFYSPYSDSLMSIKQAYENTLTDRALRNLEKFRRTIGMGNQTDRVESFLVWFIATIIPTYLIGIYEYSIFYVVSRVWKRGLEIR